MAEGMWKYFVSYSQDYFERDPWLHDPDRLWAEAKIRPFLNVSLDRVPGHSGQHMVVAEPCNTISNFAFHEASVWIGCKGHSFTRDEYASVMASLNALAPGSAFYHACACSTGGRGDTFPMDWILLQSYQILVREVVSQAGGALTADDKETLMGLGTSVGLATDLSKKMTSLAREPYDKETWEAALRTLAIPSFDTAVAGHIIFCLFALAGKFPLLGLESLVQRILDALLDTFGVGDAEWIQNTYIPTVRKALGAVTLCSDATTKLLNHLLKFAVTFVEALVFQEKMIPTPPVIREIVGWLDKLGLLTDALADMDTTWELYNGFNCPARSDHASWHTKAAHGFVHMYDMADIFATRIKSDASQC
jgi:hypothetical protein